MPSGKISGRVLKERSGKRGRAGKATRTQSARQAIRKITVKYGKILENATYYHRGRGEWARTLHKAAKKRK